MRTTPRRWLLRRGVRPARCDDDVQEVDQARTSGSRREARRSDAKAATPAEADSPSSPRGPTAPRDSAVLLADSATSSPVDANKAARKSDYDDDEPRLAVPGLEYLRRLYAPRKLLKAYEELEARVKTREFRHAPREEQEAVLAEMATVKQRIELRDNRLNHLSSLGGSLHGVYVGIMATMLSVFVAQTCPGATDASGAAIPGTHTCSISEAAARGSDFQLFVLAFNAFTLFRGLGTHVPPPLSFSVEGPYRLQQRSLIRSVVTSTLHTLHSVYGGGNGGADFAAGELDGRRAEL